MLKYITKKAFVTLPARYGALLLVALLVTLFNSPLAGQVRESSKTTAVSMLYGRHYFGLGVEQRVLRSYSASLRVEGWPHSRLAVAGVGVRLNAVAEETGMLYGQFLAGAARCTRAGWDASPLICENYDWQAAANLSAGLELLLDRKHRWSAGLEGGYWLSTTTTDHPSHASYAAVVRVRI